MNRWHTLLNHIQTAAQQLIDALQWTFDYFYNRTHRIDGGDKNIFGCIKTPAYQTIAFLNENQFESMKIKRFDTDEEGITYFQFEINVLGGLNTTFD